MAATCLVIPVPEAEPAAGELRRRHTTSGAEGMPPHVTLIHPFVDDAELTTRELEIVSNVLERQLPFRFALTSVERFTNPGESYVWLAPTPSSPFVQIIRALEAAFPDHPSFGGAHDEIVPHVTVAASSDERTLAEIAQDLRDGRISRAAAEADYGVERVIAALSG